MLHYLNGLAGLKNEAELLLVTTETGCFEKANRFKRKFDDQDSPLKITIKSIMRPRRVKQSWLTTPFTTLESFYHCFNATLEFNPDLILTTGPGIAVPFTFSAKILNLLVKPLIKHKKTKVCFVESFCRTESISLSAKILYYFADALVSPWADLSYEFGRFKYVGEIM